LFSGGYYLESSVTWILRWIQYLSTSYFGRGALANNQYDDYTINSDLMGDYVLESKLSNNLGLWGYIGGLMGLFVLFFVSTNIIFIYNLRREIKRFK
jgi:hypothetical protein